MWEALRTFSRHKCENKRDKIYALFGILRNRSIRMSYEEKESWTNLDLFREVLNHGLQELPGPINHKDFHEFLLRYFTYAEMLSGAQQERAARILNTPASKFLHGSQDGPFYNETVIGWQIDYSYNTTLVNKSMLSALPLRLLQRFCIPGWTLSSTVVHSSNKNEKCTYDTHAMHSF